MRMEYRGSKLVKRFDLDPPSSMVESSPATYQRVLPPGATAPKMLGGSLKP
jgi:hypothetical protein